LLVHKILKVKCLFLVGVVLQLTATAALAHLMSVNYLVQPFG
jgi:hypothetical protein